MGRTLTALAIAALLIAVCRAAPVPLHLMREPTQYHPTTVGTKWVYGDGLTHVITKSEKKDTECIVTVSVEPKPKLLGGTYTVAVSERGLVKVSYNPLRDENYPPSQLLVLPFKKGMRWTYEWPKAAKHACLAYPPEEVTVPAGTYRAIRVETFQELDFGGRGGPIINYDPSIPFEKWYAPGIGLVKQKYGKATVELKSFTLGK